MKSIATILLKQCLATCIFFIIHLGILFYVEKLNVDILAKTYVINFCLTAFCLLLVYLIHINSPQFVGFSYLFLVLFKMAFVVAILFSIKEFQKHIFNFMVVYLLSLFLEVYLLIKHVFKEA